MYEYQCNNCDLEWADTQEADHCPGCQSGDVDLVSDPLLLDEEDDYFTPYDDDYYDVPDGEDSYWGGAWGGIDDDLLYELPF